jgi:hypothetical protein
MDSLASVRCFKLSWGREPEDFGSEGAAATAGAFAADRSADAGWALAVAHASRAAERIVAETKKNCIGVLL